MSTQEAFDREAGILADQFIAGEIDTKEHNDALDALVRDMEKRERA